MPVDFNVYTLASYADFGEAGRGASRRAARMQMSGRRSGGFSRSMVSRRRRRAAMENALPASLISGLGCGPCTKRRMSHASGRRPWEQTTANVQGNRLADEWAKTGAELDTRFGQAEAMEQAEV